MKRLLEENRYYMNPLTGNVDLGSVWMDECEEAIKSGHPEAHCCSNDPDKDLLGLVLVLEDEEKASSWVKEGFFDECIELMDEEIREELHARLVGCSEIEFLVAYLRAHKEKFGEEFCL